MLLSAIDKDIFDKLNIGKLFLDRLGNMFGHMVGRLFGGEEGIGTETEQENYGHKNVMFERQSKIGRAKGEISSPESMKKQIKKFYAVKKDIKNRQGVVILDDSDEENTLG